MYVYCKTWGRSVTVCVQRHPNFSRGILLGATQYLTFSKQIIARIASTALHKYPGKVKCQSCLSCQSYLLCFALSLVFVVSVVSFLSVAFISKNSCQTSPQMKSPNGCICREVGGYTWAIRRFMISYNLQLACVKKLEAITLNGSMVSYSLTQLGLELLGQLEMKS